MTGTGNTPTGVGKTYFFTIEVVTGLKHPHGRGEDIPSYPGIATRTETPPRAWGRHVRKKPPLLLERNTPTGVGKTASDDFAR